VLGLGCRRASGFGFDCDRDLEEDLSLGRHLDCKPQRGLSGLNSGSEDDEVS
jgi:hypothetical protein